MGDNSNAVIGQGRALSQVVQLPQALGPGEAPRLSRTLARYGRAYGIAAVANPQWHLEYPRGADPTARGPWGWVTSLASPYGIAIAALGPGGAAVSSSLRWLTFVEGTMLADMMRVICRELAYALDAPMRALYAFDRWDLTSAVQAGHTLDQIIATMRERAGPPVPTLGALLLDDPRNGGTGRAYYLDNFSTWPDWDKPLSSS